MELDYGGASGLDSRQEGELAFPYRAKSAAGGHPDLPSIRDLVENPADKRALQLLLAREMLGRPFVAPPAVPSDRAEVLRTAFAATLLDPEFQKDANQARLDTDLVTGAELDTVLKDSAAAPQQIIDRLKQALGRN
jgi:hypothetical protein